MRVVCFRTNEPMQTLFRYVGMLPLSPDPVHTSNPYACFSVHQESPIPASRHGRTSHAQNQVQPASPIVLIASIKLPNFRCSKMKNMQYSAFSGIHAKIMPLHPPICTIANFSILQLDQPSLRGTDDSLPRLKLPILGAIPMEIQKDLVE